MFKKSISICTVAALLTLTTFTAAFAVTDQEISRSIKNEISTLDKAPFSKTRVNVLTKDGTVYLRGRVDHVSQINGLEQMAATTDGVNRVVNQLDVYSSN